MATYSITEIQLFDYALPIQTTEDGDHKMQYSYSANLIINNKFVVQISGNHNDATFDGVTDSGTCFWNNESDQDNAYENISNSDLKEALEENGFENNIGWLADNSTDVMLPENAQYRFDNLDTNND